MRAFIAALLLFSILTVGALTSSLYLSKAVEDLEQQAKGLYDVPKEKRPAATQAVAAGWEELALPLSLVLHHNEFDQIETEIAGLRQAAQIKSGNDYQILAAELCHSLQHIGTLLCIRWDNIL